MEKDEWIKRCEAQFDKTLGNKKVNWRNASEICYSAMFADFQNDPEGAANEEMSCWDDDDGA